VGDVACKNKVAFEREKRVDGFEGWWRDQAAVERKRPEWGDGKERGGRAIGPIGLSRASRPEAGDRAEGEPGKEQ